MKNLRILAPVALLLAACTAESPTVSIETVAPAAPIRAEIGYGLGSGNRTDGSPAGPDASDGGTQVTQSTMAADSVETTATARGGVMFGSGN